MTKFRGILEKIQPAWSMDLPPNIEGGGAKMEKKIVPMEREGIAYLRLDLLRDLIGVLSR